ncbi:3-oxo-tetronate kinase [Ralstonia pseudosolanacearum]|uniref:3-oxo-tetronate kinase n=1 Tax=Ralstonia pseudosolanacearum TaxID=1310165 RepID=UPI00200525FB|nr:3-oxo-tetronate kinase [Ralstonia pseudosolanacearum]
MSRPLLGCIADDFTGGTDIASMLVKGGMRTVQTIGVPRRQVADVDAIVVALKTRTMPVKQAVQASIEAVRWLREAGCMQFYFKYCSTFDSTPAGNIGPVIDALLEALGTDFTVVCPALPANGRTVYRGHLFVGNDLLSESGMRHHPLTPMTDSSLLRLLAPQTTNKAGLVTHDTVVHGAKRIQAAFNGLKKDGTQIAVVDAIDDGDLDRIGEAAAGMTLVTGGSGLALGLPQNFRAAGLLQEATRASQLQPSEGKLVVLSGSCSVATNAQVEQWLRSHAGFKVDPLALHRGDDVVSQAVDWVLKQDRPSLVYASARPDEVSAVQARLGIELAGTLVEAALSQIAVRLRVRGYSKFIVAGGETSGAVVKALGVEGLRIGESIAPGVPWTQSLDDEVLSLALKSGNFGSVHFFEEAMSTCP